MDYQDHCTVVQVIGDLPKMHISERQPFCNMHADAGSRSRLARNEDDKDEEEDEDDDNDNDQHEDDKDDGEDDGEDDGRRR